MIDQKSMEEFLKKRDKSPIVDENDIGKEAVITDVNLVDVSFNESRYKKLLVTLNLKEEDKAVEKVVFLTKSFVLDITSKGQLPEDLNAWIGRRVKITAIKVQTPKGIRNKIVIEPLPEPNEEIIQ